MYRKDKVNVIFVDGTIGSGKTTLVKKLTKYCKDLGYKCIRVDEDYLDTEEEYNESRINGEEYQQSQYSREKSLFDLRYTKFTKTINGMDDGDIVIMDHSFILAPAFIHVHNKLYNLNKEYTDMFVGEWEKKIREVKGDYASRCTFYHIFIAVSIKKALSNILDRGREGEENIQSNFLEALEEGYERSVKRLRMHMEGTHYKCSIIRQENEWATPTMALSSFFRYIVLEDKDVYASRMYGEKTYIKESLTHSMYKRGYFGNGENISVERKFVN